MVGNAPRKENMEVVTKKLRNNVGAVMLYVVMALTVVAAIAISITLVSTNLYVRTASSASDKQAYLLAKSIGQNFAAENQYIRNIVSYLTKHPTEKVTAKANVYFDPETMATSSNVNKGYLTGLSVTDAYISFHLSDTKDYLYGDVTVTYNGASATATLVMSCVNPSGFEQNMKGLFDGYDIYATQPSGMSFSMTPGAGSVDPSVALYNDSSTVALYKLAADINADLTMTGSFKLQSSTGDDRKITGNVASYGDLQLFSNIVLPATAGKYLTVNGALVLGRSTSVNSSVVVNRNVYAKNDVTVMTKAGDTRTLVSGDIYSEGNVTITNAYVENIYCVSGTVTVSGGRVGKISTKGSVILNNCTVDGDVYAGSLKVTDSTISGNVNVQGTNIGGSSLLPQGNMEVRLSDTASENRSIATGAAGKIYVSGNLTVANFSATQSLTLNGTVEVGGGLQNPVTSAGYPYHTTINGNLIVHKGIKCPVNVLGETEYYNFSFLIGLDVKGNGVATGNVVLDWSVPVFSAVNSSTDPVKTSIAQFVTLTGAHYPASEAPEGLASTKATNIAGTLFVCTNGKGSDDLAGDFALYKHNNGTKNYCEWLTGTAPAGSAVIGGIWLNNATLNNIAVGSTSANMGVATFGDVCVWGGTVSGSVYAHDICFNDVAMGNSAAQRVYARTANGKAGNIRIGATDDSGVTSSTYTNYENGSAYAFAAPAVTVKGILDATGDVTVGAGVYVTASAQLNCRGDLRVGGAVDCRVVVGNSVSNNSTAYIHTGATLGSSDTDHAFHVNGTLRCYLNAVPYVGATALAYVSRYADFSTLYGSVGCPFAHIYEYTAAPAGRSVPAGASVTYMGVDAEEGAVRTLANAYTVVYDQTGFVQNPAYDYVAASTGGNNIIGSSLVGTAGDAQVLYFSCSATVSGDLIFPGYVLVREGAFLSVTGNMRCRSVQAVADPSLAGLTSATAVTYLSDVSGANHTIANLKVSGKFQSTAEKADITLAAGVQVGSDALFATMGTVTLSDCNLGGANYVAAPNAATLKTQNNTVVGYLECKRLSATDTRLRGAYVSGNAATFNACEIVAGYGGCGIYAPQARVDLRATTWQYDIGKNEEYQVVAAQLVGDGDTYLKNVSLYLLGDNDSSCTYYHASSAYRDLYVKRGALALSSDSVYSNRTNVTFSDGGTVTKGGAPLATMTELTEGTDEYDDLMAAIDAMCAVPAVEEVATTVAIVEYEDILSYDKLSVPLLSYSRPANIVDAAKVQYVEIASKAELDLSNKTVWNEQALPLEWVFPSGTKYVAKTVDGEIVDLQNNGDTSDKMNVAYSSLSVWDTAAAYATAMWNRIKDAFSSVEASWNLIKMFDSIKNAFLAACRGVAEEAVSRSVVSDFAGIGNPDEYLRYTASKYGSNIAGARGSADLLVTSVCYLAGDSTLFSKIREFEVFGIGIGKKVTDWLDSDHPLIAKVLKNIPWSNPRYEYRPCGVFFFNSGYVPEEVFCSYTDKNHSSYSSPSSNKYRTSYNGKSDANVSDARDSQSRWRWGGDGTTASGSAADCTWTFFTCTDPANPYGSAAKDLHIVLPKHTYLTWVADSQNCVRIIGNGRVFLYLQDDTNIEIVGNHWTESSDNSKQVFGGLRYVGVVNGDTYYTTSAGRPIGVAKMDLKSSTTVTIDGKATTVTPQLQPRMFLVGTGPNIHFTVTDFHLAAYVYMPNGQLYNSTEFSGAAKNNVFTIKNTAGAGYTGVTSGVYGIYVADQIVTSGNAGYKAVFYRTAVDLSDTTIYKNNTQVTKARDKNAGLKYYRLAEFWKYPDGMPVADLPWYYKGIAIG